MYHYFIFDIKCSLREHWLSLTNDRALARKAKSDGWMPHEAHQNELPRDYPPFYVVQFWFVAAKKLLRRVVLECISLALSLSL